DAHRVRQRCPPWLRIRGGRSCCPCKDDASRALPACLWDIPVASEKQPQEREDSLGPVGAEGSPLCCNAPAPTFEMIAQSGQLRGLLWVNSEHTGAGPALR